MSEAQQTSRKLIEAAIAAADIDLPPAPVYTSYTTNPAHPGIVVVTVDCPTDPPTQANIYFVDGEALDVVWPADPSVPVFPH